MTKNSFRHVTNRSWDSGGYLTDHALTSAATKRMAATDRLRLIAGEALLSSCPL